MAIALKFIDSVVPIHVIRAKYPGGWEQCLKRCGMYWHPLTPPCGLRIHEKGESASHALM